MPATTATPALYDLSPALHLMLLGALLALGPLVWVWLRNRQASLPQRMRALTLLTLFLTFDLVLFGAFTRLTDSGLGCPDWPGCYASASPLGAKVQISAEQIAMPTGPVTHQKAWIEMIHRYAASSVGVLILVLAAMSWVHRQQLHRRLQISPWWPTLTLLWVCLQGAFGALTVTMKLFPAIVTLHLLGGMVLLALLQTQAARYRAGTGFSDDDSAANLSGTARAWLLAGFAVLWVQIALGGWVSTNYAVLACNEFPMCQGQWVPQMNMREGFELWRELGQTGTGQNITLAGLTAIHVVHRMFAFMVCAVLGVAAYKMYRSAPQHSNVRTAAWWIAALLMWQIITGLSNVVLGWPLVAAVSHTGGAAGLVIVITGVLTAARLQMASDPLERSGVATSTLQGMGHVNSAFSHLSGGSR
jgi:heme a synthase